MPTPEPQAQQETIVGTVDRIIFTNAENGFSVFRLLALERGPITAVGHLLGVQKGETLRLTGRWVHDRRFGRQFQVESYLTVQPTTLTGIKNYLSSDLVKGIGKEMADRLVTHFGLATLDVIDNEPERLTEVPGIGKVRSEKILQAWSKQRSIRQVMVFLQSNGISSHYALKIYKRYGDQAVAWVRENPFRLAQEIPGIGFRSADRIARDLGVSAESSHRLAAGLRYAAQESAQQGHVFTEEGRLCQMAADLLEVDPQTLPKTLEDLIRSNEMIAVPLPSQQGRAIYLPSLELAERGVAEWLRALQTHETEPLEVDIERAIGWFEKREKIQLAPQQRQALKVAVENKVMILTGGPGTGKTTLVRGILSILEHKGLTIQLAAPTGRAAKRLSETTGRPAKTLHRLLEYQPKDRLFARGPDHPIDADLVVVDEASMLDTVLTYNLLKAVPLHGRLILVGDVDQLPSVGPGRVLADLIESQKIEVVRLSEIFRQAQQSLIVVNAHRVRQGEMPRSPSREAGGDFFWIQREDPQAVLDTVKHLVAERIPKSFGFDPMHAIQLLTPMRRGVLGTRSLNAELQALLNPTGQTASTRGGRTFRVGDRIMQMRNNYDLDVFNGDIGHIQAIDSETEILKIDFEGQKVNYPLDIIDDLVLAYACSVHKSQGSEYPCVVFVLHSQHYMLLERNLLYTGLTRGRQLVVVVGNQRALQLAVRRQSSVRRSSLLGPRLHGQLDPPGPVPA